MSTANNDARRLERAFASVYGGPLEEFVARRDSLVKELRAARDRESASTIKALRKPSRVAWALDQGALDSEDAIGPLVAAVDGMLEAQAGGGDVRAALAALRAAVREFAGRAAHAAEQAGHGIEPGVLVNAVLAVIGQTESFDQLRGGYLVIIPEGGGLDFLASLPAPAASRTAVKPQETAAAAPSSDEVNLERAMRDAARQAVRVLAEARKRSQAARQALRDAESDLQSADARLRDAEAEARTARSQCDRARQEAEAAAADLRDAERAAEEAERQAQRVS